MTYSELTPMHFTSRQILNSSAVLKLIAENSFITLGYLHMGLIQFLIDKSIGKVRWDLRVGVSW